MMQSFFDKMQSRRSILKRTKMRADLPPLVLYMDVVSGMSKRRVLDTDGKEHQLDDAVLQSHYKLVTWGQAKELMARHWPEIQPLQPTGPSS